MKRLLITLVSLIVFAAAAVVIAPSLIEWNNHRDRVASLLSNQFGQDVEIAGELELSILPTPILSADNVRIGGASDQPPVTLSAVEVALAPGSLLGGELRILRAILVDPHVRVVRQTDGELVWPIGGQSGETAFSRLAALDRVTISNGMVTVQDEGAEALSELSEINVQFSGDLATGEMQLIGSFETSNVPLTVDLTTRPVARNGSLPVTMMMGIDGLDNELTYAGIVGRSEGGTALQGLMEGQLDQMRVQGDLTMRGSDLAEAMSRLNVISDPAMMLSQPFEVNARFAARKGLVETSKLEYSLGDIDGSGSLVLNDDEDPSAVITAVLNRLDLNSGIAAGEGEEAASSGAFGQITGFLADMEASQETLMARLPAGEIRLSVDRLSIFGDELRNLRLRAEKDSGGIQLAGLEAMAPGGGMLRMRAGYDWATQPSEMSIAASLDESAFEPLAAWLGLTDAIPLSTIKLNGSLSGLPGDWQTGALETNLDASRVTGAFRFDPEDGALVLTAAADRLNLDSYRPADFEGTTARWLIEHPLIAALRDGATGNEVRIDAQADELLVDGHRITDIQGRGGMDAETLRLTALSVGDVAGASVKMSGYHRLSVEDVDDAQEPRTDLTAALVSDNIRPLANLMAVDLALLPRGEVPSELVMRVSGDTAGVLKTNVNGALAGFDINFGGTLDRTDAPAWAGALRIIHPETEAVFEQYLSDYDPPGAIGQFDIFARVDGWWGDFAVSEVIGTLGQLVVAGEGQVSWDEREEVIRPSIEATLRTGSVDVVEWLPGGPSRSIGLWSSDRLFFDWLQKADLDIQIVGRSVEWDEVSLANPALAFNATEGVLEITRFSGDGWGGRVGMTGTLDTNANDYQIDGRIDVVGVESNAFLGQMVGTTPIDGSLDFGASIETRGRSVRDWIGALDGTAIIAVREGRIDDVDLAEAAQWVASDEEPVVFLDGLREALATGTTPFQALNARMTISQGRAHTDSLRIAALESIGTGQGSFDLNRWEVDLTTDFTLRRLPAAPPIALRLEGAADRPQGRWLTEAIQAYVAQRAAKALSNQFVEQDEPEESEAALPQESPDTIN